MANLSISFGLMYRVHNGGAVYDGRHEEMCGTHVFNIIKINGHNIRPVCSGRRGRAMPNSEHPQLQ